MRFSHVLAALNLAAELSFSVHPTTRQASLRRDRVSTHTVLLTEAEAGASPPPGGITAAQASHSLQQMAGTSLNSWMA